MMRTHAQRKAAHVHSEFDSSLGLLVQANRAVQPRSAAARHPHVPARSVRFVDVGFELAAPSMLGIEAVEVCEKGHGFRL